MALTDKQEKFVQGLLSGLSQREAYKRAYNTSKMTDKTVDEKACRLFKNDKVRTRYDEIHGKVVKKAEEEFIMGAMDVLKFWSDVILKKENDSALVEVKTPVYGDDGKRKGYKTEHKIVEMPPAMKERLEASKQLAKRLGIDKPDTSKEADTTVQVVWE